MSIEPITRGSRGSGQGGGWRMASALVLAGICLAPAHAAESLGLSGYELDNGTRDGGYVRNILFAGTTNQPCNCFDRNDNGGTWVARVDRTAGGGLGGSVTIVGGKLTVDEEGKDPRTYRINGGYVNWPANLEHDLGCGPGVAELQVTLSRRRSLSGCLDDTHLDPRKEPFVFPPKIWGTLQ